MPDHAALGRQASGTSTEPTSAAACGATVAWPQLPSDRGGCANPGTRAEVRTEPCRHLQEALGAAAKKLGLDVAHVAVACFVVLLHRHCDQTPVSIAVRRPSVGSGAGSPTETDPAFRIVTCTVEDQSTFAEVAAEVANADRAPRADLGPLGADPSSVSFWMTNESRSESPPPDSISHAFSLALTMRATAAGIGLELAFTGQQFRAERMQELLAQFRTLADQVALSPGGLVLDYTLITDLGRSLLPDPTQPIEKPRYALVGESFVAWAERHPAAVAVRHSGQDWTYSELQHASRRLAALLVRRGVQQGDVVAVTGPKSFGIVAAMLGVFRSGGVLLTLDPKLPVERRRTMLRQASAKHLVCVGDAGDLSVDDTPPVLLDSATASIAGVNADDLAAIQLPAVEATSAAYVFFTSGSTGTPKAVLGTQEGLGHFLEWQRTTFDITQTDRTAQITTLSFDMVLRDTFLALTSGATLCIPDEAWVLDPSAIMSWMEAERISVLHIVPSLLRAWLNHVPPGVHLPGLRRVFLAGEPLTDVLVHQFRAAFGDRAMITNFYGPTETTLIKCFHQVAEPQPGVQPIGRPQPQTQILILNRRRRMCGIDECGEIAIRTPFRTLGYLNAPSANAAAFVRNPFREDSDDLLYLTGDNGRYRTDGLLEIRGRMDNQVKIRGMRVEPGEIEAAIAHHPEIREVAVVAHEDPVNGKFLAAYVVPRSQPVTSASVPGLREYLRARLPENMVPAAFVVLPSLPLLPNGKVNRRALPAPDRTSGAGTSEAAESDGLPANQREKEILAIWRSVLGHERVGVTDSFVELGGDSLTAISALVRMKRLGIPDDDARGIFQGWTIRQIVSRSGGASPNSEAAMTPKAKTNLMVNVLRGVLVAVVVAGHWYDGFLNRLPMRWHGAHEALLPLFNAATPGFALVFGLALGYIYFPRYLEDPKHAVRSLRLGVWVVTGGILVRSASEVTTLLASGGSLDSTTFFNTFYSALTYYLLALLTAPLWFRWIGRAANAYLATAALAAACYVGHQFATWLLLEREQEGFIQLCRLMLVAKFNYLNMSIGALSGLGAGIYLHRWSSTGAPLQSLTRPLAGVGAALCAVGLVVLYGTTGSFDELWDAAAMSMWRWIFYAGTLLLLASLMSAVIARHRRLPRPVRTLVNVTGVLGQIALPVFVLHQLVLRAKTLLVLMSVPDAIALAIPLLAFLAVCGWMMWKLYSLYHGAVSGGRGVARVEAPRGDGG